MRLTAFRIKGFKSIVDSGWIRLSNDNVTVAIGQNEAGKSAILEALMCFSEGEIDKSFLRSDKESPEVSCTFELSKDELHTLYTGFIVPGGVQEKIKAAHNQISLSEKWNFSESECEYWGPEDDEITALLENEVASFSQQTPPTTQEEDENDALPKVPDPTEFANKIWAMCPDFVLFNEQAGELPNTIDIDELESDTIGVKAARNFLKIAKLDVSELVKGNARVSKRSITAANKKITEEFQQFWNQTIGISTKIGLQCELQYHTQDDDAPGSPYLVFWITEGDDSLYPEQRSRGVRWFLSFFLQLSATSESIFLLDEPGANLHIKAQKDVLTVIDHVAEKLQIFYTTHCPTLIDHDQLHRILAVQRVSEEDDQSPTRILSGYELGCANTDTLTPLYSAIGADFSNQDAISKDRNVILEEPSALYYLQAFWELLNKANIPNFLPATGASKVPTFANLFTGWGLSFIVIVDDDQAGRKAYNEIKKNLYGDEDTTANCYLLKNKPFKGIEDLFSKQDFKKIVLKDPSATASGENSNNVGVKGLSKPMIAIQFRQNVESGNLLLDDLSKITQENISRLVDKIIDMLAANEHKI